jgi:cytosine permease
MENKGLIERPLPDYVKHSIPVPLANRTPWYKSTFPAYASIFLWVGFYQKIAEPTLSRAGAGICVLGALVAGLLCFSLYYYVPGMLGMQTGRPLYVVGTSTFGTAGGFLIPGLLMGFLQIGWIAVGANVAVTFIMNGLHRSSHALFLALAIIWVYGVGWVAMKGIHHMARAAKLLNWVPLVMIVLVFWANRGGIPHYQVPRPDAWTGFLNVLAIVIGFFATAGAAGADFGMNNRNRKDIVLGGLFGIVAGALIAGGIPILSVAGYLGRHPGAANYDYSAAIASVGLLAPGMFFIFAAASVAPACFSSLIAANSFSTMLPKIPRGAATFAGISLSAILVITGVANNLVGFFSAVGACFGPICGAMMADYLLNGRRWSGPRLGINWAGYIAWGIGFLVGIPQQLPGISLVWVRADNPSALYSFAAGFIVYLLLAKLGLRPPVAKEEIPSTLPGVPERSVVTAGEKAE